MNLTQNLWLSDSYWLRRWRRRKVASLPSAIYWLQLVDWSCRPESYMLAVRKDLLLQKETEPNFQYLKNNFF